MKWEDITFDRAMNYIKSLRPVLVKEGTKQQMLQEAVEKGRMMEREWHGKWKEDALFGKTQNPFERVDDFYLAYQGGLDLELNVRGSDKVRNGIQAVMEAVSGGWVSIAGGNRITSGIQRTQTREELTAFQDAAWIKANMDPRGQAIANNIQFYTIGQGLRVETASKEVNEVIAAFRKMNKSTIRDKQTVRESFVEGEFFFLLFINPDTGDIKVRKIKPKEIVEIETDPEDKETRLTYAREMGDYSQTKGADHLRYYADIDYFQQLEEGGKESKHHAKLSPNKVVMFMKYGHMDELRGRVPMASILRFLKYYEDFVIDRIRLHHERAKVVWIRTLTGQGKTMTEDNRNNPLLAPKGGTIWTETQNERFRIENPNLDSSEAKEDGLHILYSVAAGVTMPIHILEQRADEAVYASIRSTDSPFAQMILANQDFHRVGQEEIYRLLLRRKVEAGDLEEEVEVNKIDEDVEEAVLRKINEMVIAKKPVDEIVAEAEKDLKKGLKKEKVKTEDIEMSIIFPEVVKENPLDMAKVALIHDKLKIVSKRTLSQGAGYNWKEELIQMGREAEMELFQPALPLGPANQDGGIKQSNDTLDKSKNSNGDIDRSVRRSGQGRLDNLKR